MHSQALILAALAAAAQAAVPQGFNYGAFKPDQSPYLQSDFEGFFKKAQSLPGTNGFTSARLYTMMQSGSSAVTGAIPAAISTKTTLLLGMWVSTAKNDDSAFKAELAALKSAVEQYGDQMKDLVVGISVGNEDMYRITTDGKANANAGPGQDASAIASFIKQTKDYLKDTPLSGVPVGHVDTWNAWNQPQFAEAVSAADFLGVDAYPYWQIKDPISNDISNGKLLFNNAMDSVKAASQGKPLWITETGWGVKGPSQKDAHPSADNAKSYWQQVGCANFGKVPTWWYTLEETPDATNPDFSIFDSSSNQPYFDLSCDNVQTTDNSTSSATSSAGTSTSTGTSSSTGSGSSNGTVTSGTPSMPSAGSGSGSGSGTSGSGSGSGPGSGSGSGSGSGTGSATGTATSAVSTAGAATIGVMSAGSLLAVVAAVAALL